MKRILVTAVFLMLLAAPGTSQEPPRDSEFIFARVQFTQRQWTHIWPELRDNPGSPGAPWWHDFPFSDEFVTSMVEEVTGVRTNGESHLNVDLADPEIFKYPFLYISEPGFMRLTDVEVKNLGEYIRRGGFIMADDFREPGCLPDGESEWDIFKHYFSLAAPDLKLVRLDVSHPIFHQFFDIETLQMETPYCDLKPEFWGLEDDRGRLRLIATFNNDLGDYWEALDHGTTPAKPSVWASQLGVNYVLYAMSH